MASAALGAGAFIGASASHAATINLTPPTLHVSGNHLLTSTNKVVVLRGVNRSGTETQCKGTGHTTFFIGPTDDASAAAIKSWHANTVRIPVNEDCWLGRNGLPGSLTAADYRNQIASYARTLVRNGLYVIIDLHFAEVNGAASTTFAPMADSTYSPQVWTSIANTFRYDPDVLFDLYNEPHVSWSCWKNGCTDATTGTVYAGMQKLVSTVRATGARQPLILTGASWGNDLSGWLANEPSDPLRSLVAAAHVYRSSGCVLSDCLMTNMAPVAARVPETITEFGDDQPDGWLLAALPAWADPLGVGYLAFTWNVPNSTTIGFHLISSFDGTPTTTGAIYRAHLALF
jgi:aryl-phospho-beta-D-glucosidase BglC (GH1 family)